METSLVKSLTKDDAEVKGCFDNLLSDMEFYPLDCAPLDIAFGGGVPSGRIVEIFAWESMGKTTLALEMIKAIDAYMRAKNDDKWCVLWIESESTIDKVRAAYLGCPMSKFIFYEANTIEMGHKKIREYLDRCKVKGMRLIIVWDTIAAVATENEKAGKPGLASDRAKYGRQMFRNITSTLAETKSTFIILNQCHHSIGQYASPNETPIPAIKYYASARIQLRANKSDVVTRLLPNGEPEVIGINVDVFFKKNKLTKPYQRCNLTMFGEAGLDRFGSNLKFLKDYKLIDVKGAGWSSVEYPASVFKKGSKAAEMKTFKFQSPEKLREHMEAVDPHLKHWLDYLVYRYFTASSPLIKVRIINRVWNYEKLFYGKPVTPMTQAELDLAKYAHEQSMKEQDAQDKKEAGDE